MAFVDLDALAVGPVVSDVSRDFDRYWASDSAYPTNGLLPQTEPARIEEISSKASQIARDPTGAKYLEAVKSSPFVRDLTQGRLAFDWTIVRMVSDDPAKGLGRAAPEALLPSMFRAIVGEPAVRMELVSAYFVPGIEGTEWFRSMASRGVKIQILTNSLEATDVAAVHAGYAKRRKRLLEAGITLFEPRAAKLALGARAPACTRRPLRSTVRMCSSARSISIRAPRSSIPRWAS
jgi:putative cardiolipin synthase